MIENHPPDPVPRIVASGREITSLRALALIETVNVPEHLVNWALLELYYLWQPGVARDAESQTAKREAWRAELREYDADPDGWNRRYYRQMLVNAALRRFEDRHESSDENE